MNVTDVLVDILVVLLAAKLAAELAERVRIPAVVGEILAGILIGPSVLDLVGHDVTLEVLAELGVILLLLDVGLELSLGDLRSVGRSSLSVATIGVVLPVAMGFGVALGFGESSNTALFVGAALAATSVGITARVFSDLGALTRVEARTVIGAAVADDVMGLVLLTIVVRVVTAGTVSVLDIVGIVAVAVAFLVIAVALGTRFGPRLFGLVDRHARSAGTFVAVGLGVHARVRGARRRGAARADRRRVRGGRRAERLRAGRADEARDGARGPPLHPGVLPPDRRQRRPGRARQTRASSP